MLIDDLKGVYNPNEPIFVSDLLPQYDISKAALSQQLKTLSKNGHLAKYEDGIYYIPVKESEKIYTGPTAETVAQYKYISDGRETRGYYSGNKFANMIGITDQVPRIVEIVTNNTNSSPRDINIGRRIFHISKSRQQITEQNVRTLQFLDLLSNIDRYMDGTFGEARESVEEYIVENGITKNMIDMYIREFPIAVFRNYFEMRLDDVLT